jgi:hypothetical protein
MLKRGFEPVRISPLINSYKLVYVLAILYPKEQETEFILTLYNSLLILKISTPRITVSLSGILERLLEATLVETTGLLFKAPTIAILSYKDRDQAN